MKRTMIGLDLAKRVFQVHAVDAGTGEMIREMLKRSQVLKYFANRQASIVAMEGCGSAHYWGRELVKLGHEVKLISAQFVRPFVKTNKTDAADAEAIWEAAQRPGMRYVALKSEEQQAVLGLHRLRAARVKMRSMQVNPLHGLMAEFGVALPKGWAVMLKQAGEILADSESCPVPGLLRTALLDQIQQIRILSEQIKSLERQIAAASALPTFVSLLTVTAAAFMSTKPAPWAHGTADGRTSELSWRARPTLPVLRSARRWACSSICGSPPNARDRAAITLIDPQETLTSGSFQAAYRLALWPRRRGRSSRDL